MFLEVTEDIFNRQYDDLTEQLRLSAEIDLYFRTTHPINQANGQSFFHKAITKGDIEVINFLLGISYEINRQDNNGRTPL